MIPAQGISAEPLFNSSLYSFSLALTFKSFCKLAAQEICAMIPKRGGLDFKKERLLCKEKISALSNDFENIFVKKFLKRYQSSKNVFKKSFLENFKTAQIIFSEKTFSVKSFQKNILNENDFPEKISNSHILTKDVFAGKNFEKNSGTAHESENFCERGRVKVGMALWPQSKEGQRGY